MDYRRPLSWCFVRRVRTRSSLSLWLTGNGEEILVPTDSLGSLMRRATSSGTYVQYDADEAIGCARNLRIESLRWHGVDDVPDHYWIGPARARRVLLGDDFRLAV